MARKLTTEEFVSKAKKVHGDKYDYSLVNYYDTKTKVPIICPKHGIFEKTPNSHLSRKSGCPKCFFEAKKTLICGVGINDYSDFTTIKGGQMQSYKIWLNIICRCYSEKHLIKRPDYKGCTVCDEWKYFSKFKRWFDKNYVEDWHIDKDILIKGNKVYSPNTCCIVPNEINSLFVRSNSRRGNLPIGVRKYWNKFEATISIFNHRTYLGLFATPELAFEAYKEAKESYIKDVADKWKDKIAPNVYQAMYDYKVEITD